VPIWLDVLTEVGQEDAVSRHLESLFGWASTKPIAFGPHAYITMTDGCGVQNRCKMAGVLPRSVLLPKLREGGAGDAALRAAQQLPYLSVPFFGCTSAEDVSSRGAAVAAHGGTVVAGTCPTPASLRCDPPLLPVYSFEAD
jgi:hypothetical protein